jgi:hypothetical protein
MMKTADASNRSARPAPTVLFIGGYGRMGSTLLDRMIGQHEAAFSGGELRHFWDRGVRDGQLCECGRPLTSCEFWRPLIDEEFGGVDVLRAEKPWLLWESVDRLSSVPRIVRRDQVLSGPIAEYTELLRRLIDAVVRRTGSRVLVDSSKYPVHGMLLALIPDIDLRVVHLVRDPRAVAFSWQRTKKRPEIHWEDRYIRKRSLLESSLAWSASSLLVEANRRSDVPQLTVRYEDLMARPSSMLDLLWRFVGLHPVSGVITDGTAQLSSGHTLSGNPSRFDSGPVRLSLDEEWREAMSLPRKALVSLATLPGLAVYGYPLSPSRS